MDTEEAEEVAVQTVYMVDGDGPFGEPISVSLQVNGVILPMEGSGLHNSRKSAPRAVSIFEATENQGTNAYLYCRADDCHGYDFCASEV